MAAPLLPLTPTLCLSLTRVTAHGHSCSGPPGRKNPPNPGREDSTREENQREEVGEAIMVPRGRREGKPLCPQEARPRVERAGEVVRPWQYSGSLNTCLEKLIFPWITPAKFSQHQENTNNNNSRREVPAVPIEPSPLKGPAMKCLLGKCRTRNIGTNSLCWPALCTRGSTHGNLN